MSGKSEIEWTDKTWNPVRGCKKVSPGCKNCYAETFAERWRGIAGHAYEQGFEPRLAPHKLGEPLSRKKPEMIFVNSMSDLFQEHVPNEFIASVFGVMAAAHWHTFQVLTKRAERPPEWFEWVSQEARKQPWTTHAQRVADVLTREPVSPDGFVTYRPPWDTSRKRPPSEIYWPPSSAPLPNVWMGVSVEDRKYGIPRIAHLRRTPAAVRFLSIEPLLEDIADDLDLAGIDWVIIGCESGGHARPFEMVWAERIIERAQAAGVKVFFKQAPNPKNRAHPVKLPVLNGRQWAEFPGVLVP